MRKMRGISSEEFINILTEYGWTKQSQKGTHATFSKPGAREVITVPSTRKELSRPMALRLFKKILKYNKKGENKHDQTKTML